MIDTVLGHVSIDWVMATIYQKTYCFVHVE